MVERAIAAGVPFAWVAADSVYGVGEIEMALRRAGKGYVLGVNATQPFNAWIGKPEVAGTAEEIAKGLDPSAWQRLSAGEGTKGPRLYDWAYLELADLDAEQYGGSATGTWTRGLLIRRSLANGECAYFTTWCPVGTTPSKGSAGSSRTRSRPRRMNSASTTMRPGRGTVGTVTSRWSCWPSPCWRPSATRPTSNHPKKL
jgi:SRSO17 transposase